MSKNALIWAVGVALVAGAVVSIWIQDERESGPPKAKATSTEGQTCDEAWAASTTQAATVSGLVERMEVTGEGLIVVVHRTAFGALPYADKERIAVAADCQIAGPGKHLKSILFREGLRGSNLAEFRGIDLLRARANFAAAGWPD